MRTFGSLAYGLRTLLKSPGFTLIAVASLALGIGVNTAVFSVVNAVLLRPMGMDAPEELVQIYTGRKEFTYGPISYLDYRDLQEQAETLSGLAVYSPLVGSLHRDGRSELVHGEIVSGNYFEVLGVRPALGRAFLPEEARTPGGDAYAVLSHGFWQRRLGSDPAVLGQTLRVSGVDYAVIGIAPREFTGSITGLSPDLWIPVTMESKVSIVGMQDVTPTPGDDRLERRGTRWLFAKGRMARTVGLAEVQANLDGLWSRLAREYPEANEERSISVLPASEIRIHPMIDSLLTPTAGVLMGIVALVLLVACANVANLVLVRATGRRREMAVRLAVGASRGQLVRQLLAENVLLAILGGASGFLIALWVCDLLTAFRPPFGIPLSLDVTPDGRVVLFASLVSLATGALFGLVPSLRASRGDLAPFLKEETHRLEGGRSRRIAWRDVLVIGQVAASMVLLLGGTLLLRSVRAAQATELGFSPEGVAVVDLNLKIHGFTEEKGKNFYRELLERVRALPGVSSASLAARVPLSADVNMEGIYLPERGSADPIPIDATYVESDYFETLGIRLLEGRDFGSQDDEGAPKTAIVNEAMARRFWPGESAIGKRFHLDGLDKPGYEVVGVASGHKVRTVGEDSRPYVHFARRQHYFASGSLIARTRGAASGLLPLLRREILALDPEIVLLEERPMVEQVALQLLPVRLSAAVFASFGALATLLAAVGLYGVVASTVARRTHEVGIRMALGADRSRVLRLVLRRGMALAVAGIAIGALASLAGTRLLASMLYGVRTTDPLAFSMAAATLLATALLANYVPARRAARLDPVAALRES